MNTFKNVLNLCFAAVLLCMTSCVSDDFLAATEPETQYEGKPLTLTVTQGNPSDTRLALGQNGLSTEWEPGDQLVLVDKKREKTPIFMDCTLTQNADKATFTSKGGVPEGEYWVIYNYNENLVYNHRPFASIEEINQDDKLVLYGELTVNANTSSPTVNLQHLYAKIRIKLKNLPQDNPLYNVTVGMYSTKNGFPICKMFNQNGLVNAAKETDLNNLGSPDRAYFQTNNRKEHNICFGGYYLNPNQVYDNNTDTYSYTYTNLAEFEMNSALILPGELTGEDVFFYVLTTVEGSAGASACYEIQKSNITFEAGKSYAVTLDLNNATKTTLIYSYSNGEYIYEVANAAQWRHFAYRNNGMGNVCKLAEDINFADEYFIPISTNKIEGNGKNISNIKLDWVEDNVGLYRSPSLDLNLNDTYYPNPFEYSCNISNLTLENVTFRGINYVGAFGGINVSADNCHIIGTSEISGSGDYVGGFVGWNNFDSNHILSKVSIGKESAVTVSGANYVGGIVGAYRKVRDYYNTFSSSQKPLNDCVSYAAVEAKGNYAGGIFGKMGGMNGYDYSTVQFDNEDYTYALLKCENYGKVSGQNYVGGVGGDFACYSNTGMENVVLEQSLSEGEVSGASYVGGILGSTYVPLNTCYSINTITGTDCVGGIVGKNMRMPMITGGTLRIANCYSIADLVVDTDKKAGGIIGHGSNMLVMDDGMQGQIYMCAAAIVANSYFAGTNPQGSGIIGNSEGGCSVINCLTVLNSYGTNLNSNANLSDVITDSKTDVTSILKEIDVINKDNAYSKNTWPNTLYKYECVKFGEFSTETGSPDFEETPY